MNWGYQLAGRATVGAGPAKAGGPYGPAPAPTVAAEPNDMMIAGLGENTIVGEPGGASNTSPALTHQAEGPARWLNPLYMCALGLSPMRNWGVLRWVIKSPKRASSSSAWIGSHGSTDSGRRQSCSCGPLNANAARPCEQHQDLA